MQQLCLLKVKGCVMFLSGEELNLGHIPATWQQLPPHLKSAETFFPSLKVMHYRKVAYQL